MATSAEEILKRAEQRLDPHALDVLDRARSRYQGGFVAREAEERASFDPLREAPAQVAEATRVDPFAFEQASTERKSIPTFLRSGFNQSVTGLLGRTMTGADPFYIDPRWEPSWAESIGAGASSFLMPADVALMGAGAAPVRLAAKLAAVKTTSPWLFSAVMRSLQAAGGFGGYEATKEAVRQQAYDEPFDRTKIQEAGKQGFVIGAATGGAGSLAAPLGKAAELGAETAALGTTGPLLEGRAPTVQDYTDAAAMIVALKAGNLATDAMSGLRLRRAVKLMVSKGEFTKDEAGAYQKYLKDQGATAEEATQIIREDTDSEVEKIKAAAEVKPPEMTPEQAAEKFGAIYNGPWEGTKGKTFQTFTDNVTKSTILVKDLSELESKLAAKRAEFKASEKSSEESPTPPIASAEGADAARPESDIVRPEQGFKVGDYIVSNSGKRFHVTEIDEDGTVRARDYSTRIPIINVIRPENVKNYRLEGEPQPTDQKPVGKPATPTDITGEVQDAQSQVTPSEVKPGRPGEGSVLPARPDRTGGSDFGSERPGEQGGSGGTGGLGTAVPKDESAVGDRGGEPEVSGGANELAGQPAVEAPEPSVSRPRPDKLVPESSGSADPKRAPARDSNNYDLNDRDPIALTKGQRKTTNDQVKRLLDKDPADITEADREVLRQYTGEGGLTSGTVEALNQHYTDYRTIRAIYDAIDRSGFKYKNALEPSVGSGNFVGHRPGAKWTTVDIDKTNYEVVRRLYPDAEHYNMSYEEFIAKDFDLVISNVPFSEQRGRLSLTIRPDVKALHDFYFLHSLDRVKPNGVIAFITSKGTMDKLDPKVRQQIVDKGDVIGAFRLPQGQFAENAHTEVTTDVIFIQRRPDGVTPREAAALQNELFVGSSKTTDDIALSNYYQEYPERILGDLTVGKDKMYGGRPAYVISGPARLDAIDIGKFEKYQDQVTTEPSKVPKGSKEFARWAGDNGVNYAMSYDSNYKYRVLISDKKVEIGGEPVSFDDVTHKARIYTELTGPEAGKILLLDKIARAASDYQANPGASHQEYGLDLIKQYAEKYRNHPSTDLKLKKLLKGLGEEGIIREGGAVFDKKFNPTSVLLEKTRYEGSGKVKADANSPIQIRALAHENNRGEVDIVASGDLTEKDIPELLRNGYALSDYSGKKPVVTNDVLYYAGNIYSRLDSVDRLLKTELASNPAIKEALATQRVKLEGIVPEPKGLGDIHIKGNEPWLIKEVEDMLPWRRKMNTESGQYEWIAKSYDVPDVVINSLNNRQLVRRKADSDGIPTETIAEYMERVIAAEEQVAKYIQRIKGGIASRPELQEKVVSAYNRTYRNYVKPDYSKASYLIQDILEEINKSSKVKLRDYQIAWVVQAMYEGRGVNAHDVGLGKTFAAITLGRALKKRGAAQKPLYVVPAKTIKNWEREIKRLFPDAKVVSLGKLSADQREAQLFDVANKNADYVLIGHEGFEHIKLTVDDEMRYINDVLAEHIDDPTLKGRPLALLQEKVAKYREALQRERRNPRLTFDKLGFDAIMVDEAHNFKNIGIRSELTKFDLGIGFDLGKPTMDKEGNERVSVKSARSYDLRFKANYISDNNNGKNVFLLTATPTQNKPMELYTMLRHISKDVLKDYGIENDRDFANTFLDVGTEQNAEGTKTKPILIGIRNGQELRGIVNRYFDKLDVPSSGHADLIAKVPKVNEITHYFEQSGEYAKIAADLKSRYDTRPRPPKAGDDTVISIYTGGRAASVDPRTYGGEHANVVIRDRSHSVKDDKVEYVIQNVGAALKNNPKGGHLIFMDRPGHANVVAGRMQEDIHTEIKKELMRRYKLKPTEVAIINGKVITNVKTGNDTGSGDPDVKKQDVSDAYNEGKIKVVIGATGSMGEGMNLQVKTTDIWHTDIPYKPGEYTQRTGRGVRFGNENKLVNVHHLLMQGTYDTMSMGIVYHKKGWNEAFWDKEVSDYISTRSEMSQGGMPSQEQIAIELEADPIAKHGLIVNYHTNKLIKGIQTEASVARSLEFKVKEQQSTITHYERLIENLPRRIEEHKANEKIEDLAEREADFKAEADRLQKLTVEYPRWVEEHKRRLSDVEDRLAKVRERESKARAALAAFQTKYLDEKGKLLPTTEPLASPAEINKLGKELYSGFPVPAIARGVETVMSRLWQTKVADGIKKVLAPAARGTAAKTTAGVIRENAAEMALTHERAAQALKEARGYFVKAGEQTSLDFMDAVETGRSTSNADMDRFAEIMREQLDTRRDAIQDLGTGKLQNFIENYFPHIWKDARGAQDFFAGWFAKRPLEGKKAFLKKRTIPTIADGIAAGLEPVSYNPVDLVMLKAQEMDKYLMAHRTLQEMRGMGLAKFVSVGRKHPDGWIKIDDKIAVGFRRGAIDYGQPDMVPQLVIAGHYYAPEPAAKVLHNYLSPGLSESSAAFRSYREGANILNMFQLGMSAFHLGFTSFDAATSKTALGLKQLGYGTPLKALKSFATTPLAPITNAIQGHRVLNEALHPGAHPELKPIVDAMVAGGGRVHMDSFYRTNFRLKMVDAFRENRYWSALWRSPFAATEAVMWPILEYVVPRQKLGVFADLARMEIERNPGMGHTELRKTMGKIWDSVDNRLGQLVYDNLFWHKVTKDLAMASVRSVGWNLGTLREIGGGGMDTAIQANRLLQGKKPEMTYRMSYLVAFPIVAGISGAITQYLMTGRLPGYNKAGEYEGDDQAMKDLYFPRTGDIDDRGRERRVVLPTYMKDVFHYAHDPVQTILNKAHPAISTIGEMFANEDFYGTEIRNADDPMVQQMLDLAKHAGKTFEPFAFRGLRQNLAGDEGPVRSALPFIGITPAPARIYKTKAEDIITEYQKRTMPAGPRTKEQAVERDLKRDLRKLLRKQAGVPKELQEAVTSGKLTIDEAYDMLQSRDDTPIQSGFRSLPMYEALKVWDAATPDEREQVVDAAVTKVVNFFENASGEDVRALTPEVMKLVEDIKRIKRGNK